MRVFLLLLCAWAAQGKAFFDKTDRYLIACHTTDFECFKRQFSALRDHVLLGNAKLDIGQFEPYTVQYGNSCLQISGWEESELAGIAMDNATKELSLVLELPVHIQQLKNETKCAKPTKEFTRNPHNGDLMEFYGNEFTQIVERNLQNDDILEFYGNEFTKIVERNPQNGDLMEFYGNATVTVIYPYTLLKKKGDIFLILDEEDVDALIDLPIYVLEGHEAEAAALNNASEWAYDIVQHIDAANAFALPFTSRLRIAMDRIPFRRLMLLYPEEEYSDIEFAYIDLTL